MYAAVLRTKLRRFNTSIGPRFLSSGNNGEGEFPVDPIPNRPLRRPRNPNPNTPKFQPNRIQHRNETDADFLERFKLSIESPPPKAEESKPEKKDDEEEEEKLAPSTDADEIFRKMKETGLIPNAVAMLDGLCKDGLVQEAMKLFGLMRERGTIPEVVVYTAVIEGFCKASKLDDATRVFKKMKGNGVAPNAFTYGVLVRGFCKGKRLEDAYGFGVEMLEAGHRLNLPTFAALVDGFCREKGVEEAQSVVRALRDKGLFYEEKAIREFLDRKGPFAPEVWEAILGKKPSNKSFF